jgi:immune inhibitor A
MTSFKPLFLLISLLAVSMLACASFGLDQNSSVAEKDATSESSAVETLETEEPVAAPTENTSLNEQETETDFKVTITTEEVGPSIIQQSTSEPQQGEIQGPAVPETADQPANYEALSNARPPERDDIELARAYQGWNGTLEPVELVEQPLPVGTIQTLNVLNHDNNTVQPIESELLAVGDHAYFWFDIGQGSIRPDGAELAAVSDAFDEIYLNNVEYFGQEKNPGVDGDPRLHVVNASPFAMCDNSDDEGGNCGIAGYFDADNGVPSQINPTSNAREMFVMRADLFGSDFYIEVLAHEHRHMIEDNYDSGDDGWEVEGSAMLAEDLQGMPELSIERANLFLSQPDQQLNRWPDENTSPHYGQGYLFNRYIFDRLGKKAYGQFATSPERGLAAIDSVAAVNNLSISGEQMWLDWLVATAIHDRPETPEMYQFGVPGLDTAAMTEVGRYPAEFTETVDQYAADFYHLKGSDELTMTFEGDDEIPILDTEATSGDAMWLSNRANYSHMRLTREVDLTDVETATLNYNVYHDIEIGYDFAYVFVSEDEGQTWKPLLADNMQGLGQEDDPSGSALAERFYTGQSNGWRNESIDLTQHAGTTIQVRLAYITDQLVTFGGIAFDDIAIPEIDFFDDVENQVDGWTAEGFDRVSTTLPQRWHLQLITFPDGQPQIEQLELDPDGSLLKVLSLAADDGNAILIVAASAPQTLEPAHYQLTIKER